MEYYLAIKKNNAICSNMDGPRDCHTEWSKSDRKGDISCDIPYVWNPKINDTDELRKQNQTHRFREWTCVCQREGWGEGIVGCDGQVRTAIFQMDNQQGSTVAQGTLLHAMPQPGWEGSLGENGHMHTYGWVPSLFIWHYHKIVC